MRFWMGVIGVMMSMKSTFANVPIQDPYLWLEEKESPRALDWVKTHNDRTLTPLKADARFGPITDSIAEILMAQDRVPGVSLRQGMAYGFWQDKQNPKGLWRRSPLGDYLNRTPQWETLLDLDQLGKSEGKSWTWNRVDYGSHSTSRCLIFMSEGGEDAVTVREFDLTSKQFVRDGFTLPRAKTDATWLGADALIVSTDTGEGSLTESGYPRRVRLWRRGTAFVDAPVLIEAAVSEMGAFTGSTESGDRRLTFITKNPTFFTTEIYEVSPEGALARINLPLDAEIQGVVKNEILVRLRTPWKTGKRKFKEGSVVSVPSKTLGATREFVPRLVFAPSKSNGIPSLLFTRDFAYMSVSEHVKSRVLRFEPTQTGWSQTGVRFPRDGTVYLLTSDPSDKDNRVIASYTSFLVPTTHYEWQGRGRTPRAFWNSPKRFDSEGMKVEQRFAKSRDGTRVPYFLILPAKKNRVKGALPTLLNGYGGFEIARKPEYLGILGKVWLERGGAYAVANIRGGGEYGPLWHSAALREHRQRAYDDFFSVSKDLIKSGVTNSKKLAISGGSNGGLLMGVALTQHPELYRAILCTVPLLDMLRYHELPAGASWMEEYGDPRDPKMAAAIAKYSPYQNLKPAMNYPSILFTTSTKDDRVHCGHARKMAARMEELGYHPEYYEETEGGHTAGGDLRKAAEKKAYEITYLWRELTRE